MCCDERKAGEMPAGLMSEPRGREMNAGTCWSPDSLLPA